MEKPYKKLRDHKAQQPIRSLSIGDLKPFPRLRGNLSDAVFHLLLFNEAKVKMFFTLASNLSISLLRAESRFACEQDVQMFVLYKKPKYMWRRPQSQACVMRNLSWDLSVTKGAERDKATHPGPDNTFILKENSGMKMAGNQGLRMCVLSVLHHICVTPSSI